MDRDGIISELKELIGSRLSEKGLELVDLIYRYEGSALVLRVLVDWPQGGITLAECSQLNQEIGEMLEERENLQQKYILEVSSPGIDRPLREKSDFQRCLQRKAHFFLREPIGGKIELEGRIVRVQEGSLQIESAQGSVEIPLAIINKAKQLIN